MAQAGPDAADAPPADGEATDGIDAGGEAADDAGAVDGEARVTDDGEAAGSAAGTDIEIADGTEADGGMPLWVWLLPLGLLGLLLWLLLGRRRGQDQLPEPTSDLPHGAPLPEPERSSTATIDTVAPTTVADLELTNRAQSVVEADRDQPLKLGEIAGNGVKAGAIAAGLAGGAMAARQRDNQPAPEAPPADSAAIPPGPARLHGEDPEDLESSSGSPPLVPAEAPEPTVSEGSPDLAMPQVPIEPAAPIAAEPMDELVSEVFSESVVADAQAEEAALVEEVARSTAPEVRVADVPADEIADFPQSPTVPIEAVEQAVASAAIADVEQPVETRQDLNEADPTLSRPDPTLAAIAGVGLVAGAVGSLGGGSNGDDSEADQEASPSEVAEAEAILPPSPMAQPLQSQSNLSARADALLIDRAALATVDDDLPDLPDGYGESRIVLMPRDPRWAYTYWDISSEHKESVRQQGGQHLALRLYDVTDVDIDTQTPHNLQQYSCDEMARTWYLPIPESDRDYIIEIGYLTHDGDWLLLARSASAHIPPVFPSDWIDDRFVTVDWSQDLHGQTLMRLNRFAPETAEAGNTAISDAIFAQAQSTDALRVAGSMFGSMQQVPTSVISSYVFPSGLTTLPAVPLPNMSGLNVSGLTMSGVGFSADFVPPHPRKFWLVADAELIVYGATEPDATVTVGDEEIQLSPDGTFRFQMSFQDGELDFPIHATANDGEQTREVELTFDRQTPERNTNTKDEANLDWFE